MTFFSRNLRTGELLPELQWTINYLASNNTLKIEEAKISWLHLLISRQSLRSLCFFTLSSIILLSFYLVCAFFSCHLLPSLLFCWLSQTTVTPLPQPSEVLTLFASKHRVPSGGQGQIDGLRRPQTGGRRPGPAATHPPTQRCQSAGQTPAASPLGGARGSTLGSGPVRPALHLTRLSSHRRSLLPKLIPKLHSEAQPHTLAALCLRRVPQLCFGAELSDICMAASQFLSLGG